MSSVARITDTGRVGDLRVSFGFERFEGRPQPHMLLSAVNRPQAMAAVPLKLMYLFDPDDRDEFGQPKCMAEVRRVAKALYGAEPTRNEVYRVMDAIQNFMTDLKNMPPPSVWRDPNTLERALAVKGYDIIR